MRRGTVWFADWWRLNEKGETMKNTKLYVILFSLAVMVLISACSPESPVENEENSNYSEVQEAESPETPYLACLRQCTTADCSAGAVFAGRIKLCTD